MKIWVLSDPKAGTIGQCLGLAELLANPADIAVKESHPGRPWRWLPARWWPWPLKAQRDSAPSLRQPWPDLIIAAGRSAVAPAAAIRRKARGKTKVVAVLNPRLPPDWFDLMVVPAHDALSGPNIVVTDGALNRVTPARLAEAAEHFRALFAPLPRPLAAVLIGGDSAHYKLDRATAEKLGRDLAALKASGVGLAITASRRTSDEARTIIAKAVEGPGTYFWDGKGDNPYFGLLALADHLLVTADSVSMISEAATTGKPVQVIDLVGGSPKLQRFHAHMQARGAARPFRGTLENWHYPPLDDTTRAAEAIRALFVAPLRRTERF